MPTHNAEEWAGSGEALGSAVMKEEGPLTHPKTGHYKKALMRGLSCPSAFSSHKNGRGNLEAEGGRETIPLSLWVEDKVGKGPGAGSRKQETAKPTGPAHTHPSNLPSLPLKSSVRA